jgi:hypothetical protein
MAESLISFASLFRAVLLLHGIESPVTKNAVVKATVKHLKIDGEPFEKIFEIRQNSASKTLDEVSANQLFANYMEQIERVIDAVDKIKNRKS